MGNTFRSQKRTDLLGKIEMVQPIPARSFKVITEAKAGDITLKVMSYNILASNLAGVDWHSHTIEEVLDFKYRGPRIVKEIVQANCDVVCLQELDQLEFYTEQLSKHGYMLQQVTRHVKTDGVGIAWKSDVLKKLSDQHIDFDLLVGQYDERYRKDNHGQLIHFEHVSGK